MLAFLYPQVEPGYFGPPEDYRHARFLTTVDEMERLTGLDFRPCGEPGIEKRLERQRASGLWEPSQAATHLRSGVQELTGAFGPGIVCGDRSAGGGWPELKAPFRLVTTARATTGCVTGDSRVRTPRGTGRWRAIADGTLKRKEQWDTRLTFCMWAVANEAETRSPFGMERRGDTPFTSWMEATWPPASVWSSRSRPITGTPAVSTPLSAHMATATTARGFGRSSRHSRLVGSA